MAKTVDEYLNNVSYKIDPSYVPSAFARMESEGKIFQNSSYEDSIGILCVTMSVYRL